MNYFTGSFYGNYEAYITTKEKLKLKEYDTLWILGDIFDGNTEKPQQSLMILEDIRQSDNIHLVLGDHEFAHIMRFISKEDKEGYESWKNYLLSMPESTQELIHFFEEEIDDDMEEDIFDYLIQACEITQLIPIGDNFFYALHGFPAPYEGHLTKWQLMVSGNDGMEPDFLKNIKTDPLFEQNKDLLPKLTKQNTFVICSHTRKILLPGMEDGIWHNNGVFLITNNIEEEKVSVLGIDAAGYFFRTISL